jgi:hypothetical protein
MPGTTPRDIRTKNRERSDKNREHSTKVLNDESKQVLLFPGNDARENTEGHSDEKQGTFRQKQGTFRTNNREHSD